MEFSAFPTNRLNHRAPAYTPSTAYTLNLDALAYTPSTLSMLSPTAPAYIVTGASVTEDIVTDDGVTDDGVTGAGADLNISIKHEPANQLGNILRYGNVQDLDLSTTPNGYRLYFQNPSLTRHNPTLLVIYFFPDVWTPAAEKEVTDMVIAHYDRIHSIAKTTSFPDTA